MEETEGFVREILATYELPKPLESRLERIATVRLDELFITGFDSQYRYIAHLVEQFTPPRWSKKVDSLDEYIHADSSKTYHDTVADEGVGSRLQRFGGKVERSNLETKRAIDLLRTALTSVQYNFVEELIASSSPKTRISAENVKGNITEIHARLDEIAKKYRANGRFVFPRRRILDIRFHPLCIRFGRRSMNDLLVYYTQHKHLYEGVRRKELFDIDQSLYQALRAKGQLDQAIPEAYKRRE